MGDTIESNNWSRRGLLGTLGAGLASIAIGNRIETPRSKPFRIAYLTDIHLSEDAVITERATMALSQLKNVDLVIFGGDNLMAIDHVKPEQVAGQMKNWNRVIEKTLKVPYRCILGNHDIEQWEIGDNTPLNGKRRALDHFKMKSRFWAEEFAGWKIIGLDTVQKKDDTFYGKIDQEQMEWLEAQLRDSKPKLVVGHIPLMTITALANSGLRVKDGVHQLSTGSMCENGKDVVALFRKYGNVKLALSGHTHMIDNCEYDGTSYMCAGAVCGGWWNGSNQGFDPAYHIVELSSETGLSVNRVDWMNKTQ
jgi:3',5'-cyclic-AMP phosphodiesterase